MSSINTKSTLGFAAPAEAANKRITSGTMARMHLMATNLPQAGALSIQLKALQVLFRANNRSGCVIVVNTLL
jgi:hypothetical protein